MKKIVLIGDSIRQIGYGRPVAERLSGEYEVWQPGENCRFAKYTLRGLFDRRGDMKESRIVHRNNGLWDMCDLFGDGCFADKDEHFKTMLRIADILLSKHEKVNITRPLPKEAPTAKISTFRNTMPSSFPNLRGAESSSTISTRRSTPTWTGTSAMTTSTFPPRG